MYLRNDQRALMQRPRLPSLLDGELVPFNFCDDERGEHPSYAWLLALLDELDPELRQLSSVQRATEIENVLHAWKHGRLLGACMKATDNLRMLRHQHADMSVASSAQKQSSLRTDFSEHFMFAPNNSYHFVLPCLIITSAFGRDDTGAGRILQRIWVAPRARRRGIGRMLCAMHPHEYAHATQHTFAFWHAVGHTETATPPQLRAPAPAAHARPAPASEQTLNSPTATPPPYRTPASVPRTPARARGGFASTRPQEHHKLLYKVLYNDARTRFKHNWQTDLNDVTVIKAILRRQAPDIPYEQRMLLPIDPLRAVSTSNFVVVSKQTRHDFLRLFYAQGPHAYKERTEALKQQQLQRQ